MKLLLSAVLLVSCLLTTVHASEKQTVNVSLDVPDTTWSLTIDLVYQSSSNLYVISSLHQAEGMMGATVITTLQDKVEVQAEALPQKHFVLGKTWNWENKGAYTFIKNRTELPPDLKTSTLIYKRAK